MVSTSFWGADGKPISVEEFLNNLYDTLPSYFKDEAELREIWPNPITRNERVAKNKPKILSSMTKQQQDFLEFLLFRYIETGYGELDQSKLPNLIQLKYRSMTDATQALGCVEQVRDLFFGFQNRLYENTQELKTDIYL